MKRLVPLFVLLLAADSSCIRLNNTLIDFFTAAPNPDLIGGWECIEYPEATNEHPLWVFIGISSRRATSWGSGESTMATDCISKGCMQAEVISLLSGGRLDRSSCQFIPVDVGTATYINISVFCDKAELEHALLMKYALDEDAGVLKLWLLMSGEGVRALIEAGKLS